MVLRDGTAEADLVVDIDDETVSLLQGDQLLGQYSLDEIHFLRWSRRRIILSIAGESPDSLSPQARRVHGDPPPEAEPR
jgi:hypothetical protein